MDNKTLKKLHQWFYKNVVSLPWRPTDLSSKRDPYVVWISETMLQQTQVATVIDYFSRWIKRFPDVSTLATTKDEEVLKYWQGLGYYSRAKNILKTAHAIVNEFGGKFPENRKQLEHLPGIGKYTAGAILSLAYHQNEPILDGNLIRIFSRLWGIDFLPTSKEHSQIYWSHAQDFAAKSAHLNNEALMELGRTVCKVRDPLCHSCPLQKICQANLTQTTSQFPPSKKHVVKNWNGTILIVESSDGKILGIKGGHYFLNNQLVLPHFERPRGNDTTLPPQVEEYLNTDHILQTNYLGTFRHSITIHKICANVLHIIMSKPTTKCLISKRDLPQNIEFRWIEKAKATTAFANSFSLKAIKLL